MKTTKRTSLDKRIEKLVATKELSKNSIVYKWLIHLKSNDELRPVYTQGQSWKHSSLVDKEIELKRALRLLSIDFQSGNDAPRGGKTGVFVKILTKILD